MNNEALKNSFFKKENERTSYDSPLLQNFQSNEFTEDNFPAFQKDIGNILTYLLTYLHSFGMQITQTNIADNLRVEMNIGGIDKQCKLLGEYCNFFREFIGKIPLPYEYLGDIAHRIKIYALTIRGFITMYKEEKKENRENNFNEIKNIIKIMTEDIFKVSLNVDYMEFKMNTYYKNSLFSPVHITRNIIELQKPFIEEKKITIKNMIPDNHIVNSYKEVFKIVINNLITNAVKFTPHGGEIYVGIKEEKDDFITFFVKDSGIGIPENVDVFKHEYTTLSTEGKKGTGLGLTQSKIFLDITRGWISYEKNMPSGTIFSFTIRKKRLQ